VRELFSAPHARRARLVVAVQAFQQLTGINVILYFAASLIERAGGGWKVSTQAGSVVAGGALHAAASPTVTGRVNTKAHTRAVRANMATAAAIPGR
jgi:hypothetical protein